MANQAARRLRKTMTPQDVKVWVHLRSWRQRGYHFRRQAPRKDFIVDFVCLKHCLLEIDGGQHNLDSHRPRDESRDDTPGRAGFRTLQFWNSDVDRNLAGVWQSIDQALRELHHPTAFGGHPSPAGDG
jgi:very-short-patch-repair endonuclease